MNAKRLFFLFLLIGLAVAFLPLPVRFHSPTERLIRIQAGRFAYSPGEISVEPGERVTLELASTDVVHGLYLDGYDLSVTADPGQTARLSFVADKAGSFRFRCNVTCGTMHPFMIGKLNVGPDLMLWRAGALALLALAAGLLLFRAPAKEAR